jgi:hypothetical protein
MADRSEDIISELLTGAVEELDIPEALQDAAEATYGRVGEWFAEQLADDADWHVYPQGSMRLGTVVRPSPSDDYDIDAVAKCEVPKERTTKQELKDTVGEMLSGFVAANQGEPGAPTDCEEGARCWTLLFSDPFHMDVLPAIPNPDAAPHGIQITDRDLYQWQPSNPIAFANWFYTRMGPGFLREKVALAKRAQVNVDEVPDWRVRTTLQRVVQVLKVHRNGFFANELDQRPPSIIVTTLAAHAFTGDKPLFDAVVDVAANMTGFIEGDADGYVVSNPVQPEENFADRWGSEAERTKKFFAWIDDLQETLESARSSRRGLNDVAAQLQKRFGVEPINKSLVRFGERRRDDRTMARLTVASTGMIGAGTMTVRDHTFHG